VPPRRKHSGKILKQQSELSASLSKSNTEQSFNGLPPIPKVKVRPEFLLNKNVFFRLIKALI
jgi:hypothetical protein